MINSEQKYGISTWYYHLINLLTYFIYKILRFINRQKIIESSHPAPVIITGMFRSGTTLTASIIQKMGFSPGPENHLLKARGRRKYLNPKGFLENFYFMELTLVLFAKTGSWGDNPPDKEKLQGISFGKLNHNEGVKFSLLKIHDDRISNYNKLKVLLSGSFSSPDQYLRKYFAGKSFIKNPHFAVLMPLFESLFMNSKVIVVFKEPASAIASAKKITGNADYGLYRSYYSYLVEQHQNGNHKIFFFSYENLLEDTEKSISNLQDVLHVKHPFKNEYSEDISKEYKGKTNEQLLPGEVMMIYNYMQKHCVNSLN